MIFKKIVICIFFILIFFSDNLFARESVNIYNRDAENIQSADELPPDHPERKDPFVAGLLSWSWTGLGQFYTQDYTRGSLFLMTSIAQDGLLIYLIFYYSHKYTSRGVSIAKWENLESRDKGIIIGFIFSILAVKVASVLDAVSSAEKYNREIFFPYWKNTNKVRLSIYTEEDRVNISLVKQVRF